MLADPLHYPCYMPNQFPLASRLWICIGCWPYLLIIPSATIHLDLTSPEHRRWTRPFGRRHQQWTRPSVRPGRHVGNREQLRCRWRWHRSRTARRVRSRSHRHFRRLSGVFLKGLHLGSVGKVYPLRFGLSVTVPASGGRVGYPRQGGVRGRGRLARLPLVMRSRRRRPVLLRSFIGGHGWSRTTWQRECDATAARPPPGNRWGRRGSVGWSENGFPRLTRLCLGLSTDHSIRRLHRGRCCVRSHVLFSVWHLLSVCGHSLVVTDCRCVAVLLGHDSARFWLAGVSRLRLPLVVRLTLTSRGGRRLVDGFRGCRGRCDWRIGSLLRAHRGWSLRNAGTTGIFRYVPGLSGR